MCMKSKNVAVVARDHLTRKFSIVKFVNKQYHKLFRECLKQAVFTQFCFFEAILVLCQLFCFFSTFNLTPNCFIMVYASTITFMQITVSFTSQTPEADDIRR